MTPSADPVAVVILILATWRLSSLVANETGPFHVFEKFRRLCAVLCNHNRFAAEFHLYELVECEWCNSIWIGAAVTAAYFQAPQATLWAALPLVLSAGTIYLKHRIQLMEKELKDDRKSDNPPGDSNKPVHGPDDAHWTVTPASGREDGNSDRPARLGKPGPGSSPHVLRGGPRPRKGGQSE